MIAKQVGESLSFRVRWRSLVSFDGQIHRKSGWFGVIFLTWEVPWVNVPGSTRYLIEPPFPDSTSGGSSEPS